MSTQTATAKKGSELETYGRFLEEGRPGPHAYAVLLGIHMYDTAKLMKAIAKGFPIRTYDRFQKSVGVDSATLAELLQIPPRTLARRRQQGFLQPAESDRLLTISRVFARALDLFEASFDEAREWMKRPQPSLDGRTPLEAMRTELGTSEVERLIGRLEQGVYA